MKGFCMQCGWLLLTFVALLFSCKRDDSQDPALKGIVDDFKLYNIDLTEQEIEELYRNP